MGIVNVITGLESKKEIHNFNGIIRDNINLNWNYVKFYPENITPDHDVTDDEIIIIQELPGVATTALLITSIILGIVTLGVGIGVGIYAHKQAEKARREMEDALKRIGKENTQKDVSSIPHLADARNERADGKNVPIIIGRHLFTPYFLSEPYMRLSGIDGEDLYWYASFVCGQAGLCFEKISNGANDLITLTGDIIQKEKIYFDPPSEYDPEDPPPFYTPENFVEIIQDGYEVTEPVFEQKWIDSLESTVEIERKKKDNAQIIDDLYIEDDGEDPVIRESSRFPMRLEIELFLDGLHGWDSENMVETNASVGVIVEWSTSDTSGWNRININNWTDNNWETETFMKDTSILNIHYRLARITGESIVSSTITHNTNGGSYGVKKGLTRITTQRSPITHIYNVTLRFSDNSEITNTRNISETLVIGGGLHDNANSEILTRAKATQMRFLAEVDLPSHVYSKDGKPVYIRARRTTRMYAGGYRDRVYLTAIRTQQYNPKLSSSTQLIPAKNINNRLKDKICRLGIKIKVNKNTQEFLDRFNITASMTGRTWDNGWSNEKTKITNPAAAALEVLTGLIHLPSKHTDNEIDLKSFGELYEYCNDREVKLENEGIRVFNLESNGVVSNGTKKLDLLKLIFSTCDAGLYINEFGILSVCYDHAQTTPIALLNPQRIVRMSDNRSLERKTDGYIVEIIDQEAGWVKDTFSILRPRANPEAGLATYTPIKLDFTTTYVQAMWHARRMMAKEIHRPGDVKVTVGKEGRYYKPGSLIKVQHERFKIGLGSGEITGAIREGNMVTGLMLMERFDIASDRDYWIEYYVVDEKRNHVVTKQIQSVGEYTDRLMFTIPISIDSWDVPVMGNILSTMFGEKTGTPRVWEAKRYLVSDLSENEDGYDLSLVPYADIIYQTTSIDEIPDYQSHILNAPPRVYDSFGRRPIDGEGGQGLTTVQEVTRLARDTADRAVDEAVDEAVEKMPRYRGAYYQSDIQNTELLNTGIIGGKKMNPGDWVAYLGTPQVTWRPEYCYRWTGTKWEEIPISESAPYMAALADLTRNAPAGVFSHVFTSDLLALKIVANIIGAKEIEMEAPGVIRSKGFNGVDGGVNGYRLTAVTGLIEAIGAVLVNAMIKGTLTVGNVWDENGNVINANTWGSFLALNKSNTEGQYRIYTKDLEAFGQTTFKPLGNNSNRPNRVTYLIPRRVGHGAYTETGMHFNTLDENRTWYLNEFIRWLDSLDLQTTSTRSPKIPVMGVIRVQRMPVQQIYDSIRVTSVVRETNYSRNHLYVFEGTDFNNNIANLGIYGDETMADRRQVQVNIIFT